MGSTIIHRSHRPKPFLAGSIPYLEADLGTVLDELSRVEGRTDGRGLRCEFTSGVTKD